jgi:Putative Flp pilus-assembly TadE/G-like
VKSLQPLAPERGAILINAVLTLMVWFGIATFVADYGVLWVGRHQAQNAADAGALAGALARAYDDFDDPPDPGGETVTAASQVVAGNPVWGTTSPPVTTFTCPAEVLSPRRCVRVDVYRNGDAGSSPLPTWFGRVSGIMSQGVKATATAQAMSANATNCLRPWAIPDSWTPGLPPGPDFQMYDGAANPIHFGDYYAPPSATDPGTGYRFATSNAAHYDLGLALPLSFSTNPTSAADLIYPGWIVPLEPPASYAASSAACNGQIVQIGDTLPISATHPASPEFAALYDADSTAFWDATTASIHGSCAPACAPFSPRLVAVPVFNVEELQYRRLVSDWTRCPTAYLRPCTPCPGGVPCVTIVNIVGLFIGNAAGSSGTLASYPGLIPTGPPLLSAQSSFLKAITLVR